MSEGKVGPLLTAVGDRLSPDQIKESIVDPKSDGHQPDSAMPRFDLTDDEVDGLMIFLTSQRRSRIVDQKLPDTIGRYEIDADASASEIARGEAFFSMRGCSGCHAVRTGPDTLAGGLGCPELTYAGRMRGAEYINRHIVNPKRDVADSVMPLFDFLPDEERDAIVAYLMSLSFTPDADEGLSLDQRAKNLYETLCASCHGNTGSGLGPTAEILDPKPKNFQKRGFVAAYADRFADRILNGVPGTPMPPWQKILSQEEAEAITRFIKTDLAKVSEDAPYVREETEPPPPAAETEAFQAYLHGGEVFEVYCAGCHGRLGTGKGANAYDLLALARRGPGGHVQGEMLPRNLRNPKYYDSSGVLQRKRVYNSIRLGVPGTGMPAWERLLPEEQIKDVTEFVMQINNREFEQRAKEER